MTLLFFPVYEIQHKKNNNLTCTCQNNKFVRCYFLQGQHRKKEKKGLSKIEGA
jgi:hypothetical protein